MSMRGTNRIVLCAGFTILSCSLAAAQNYSAGTNALSGITTGTENTAVGDYSL